MTNAPIPEIVLPAPVARSFSNLASELGGLEKSEAMALDRTLLMDLERTPGWTEFSSAIRDLWVDHDHVVIRGLPHPDDGTCLIFATLALGSDFKSYRGSRVVKQFTMSPWTTALSHTLAEGHFHTDLNTAASPPRITAIHCVTPDPSAPHAGEVRIARLRDLIALLEESAASTTLDFLRETVVTMVNDSDAGAFRGRIVEGNEIRFHPETLRAAQRRLHENPDGMEEHLEIIKSAAMRVSTPIHLFPGDAVLVSNTRALHYRGACTVRFRRFPRDFESRSVNVLHLRDEPQ